MIYAKYGNSISTEDCKPLQVKALKRVQTYGKWNLRKKTYSINPNDCNSILIGYFRLTENFYPKGGLYLFHKSPTGILGDHRESSIIRCVAIKNNNWERMENKRKKMNG
jgi:hypothetical protein